MSRKSTAVNVLQSLGQNKAANIYKKYQEQMDMQPLNVNLEYLKLQVKALFLEREENIKVINDFLQQIEEKLNTIKQVTSEQELEKLQELLSDFLEKLDNNLECQQVTNSYIRDSIRLTVISSHYIINKMLLILKENATQGSIGEFLKVDLRTHFEKYAIAELNLLKDSTYKNELTRFKNYLDKKIKYNCFLEKYELDNIKKEIKYLDENKLKLLKKKSLLDFTKVNELQLYLEYIIKQINLLYDVDNFEKYLENIKGLKKRLITLNNNDIKKLDLKNLIEEFNNIAFISYDPLFAKPAKNLAEKNQLLGFLTLLFRTLNEQLTDKIYLIKNESLRNDFLESIKNMTQAVQLTKEHLLYVTNVLQNSKGGKDCSYSGYQELKQTIFNAYFIVTLAFPKQNFNKLKNKIAKLIDLELKDESEKKSSYLHTIIYLDTVLEILQSKQSMEARLFTELNEIRSCLTRAKIALLTATHLKPVSQNLDLTNNQEENLITSNANTSKKNPIGIKKILLEQIRGTINCLNSDFEILEKNRSLKYQGKLFSIFFSENCNKTSRIQGMLREITYLLNSNHPNIKPIQTKLHSIHLKLDFLRHSIKLYEEALGQEKIGVINSRFLDLYGLIEMENEFILKLLKIKQLFKNTPVFDKFLRLEEVIFNSVNSTNIFDAVDIELLRVKLQSIKKILDEFSPYIIQIKNQKNKETVHSLLEEFKTLVTSPQINNLLNDLFINIKENSLKKNQSHAQKQQSSPPPLPPKKNRRNANNENNAGTYRKNRFFKPTNQNNYQVRPLNNITNYVTHLK
ncbi:hypothetical protein FQR65_LT05162 [Abscondita terminalis]|nr:hypothetical protein FQR65_LT05162 [Abscondita terminalis]